MRYCFSFNRNTPLSQFTYIVIVKTTLLNLLNCMLFHSNLIGEIMEVEMDSPRVTNCGLWGWRPSFLKVWIKIKF